MAKTKRISAGILAVIMAFSAAACGQKTTEESTSSASAAPAASDETTVSDAQAAESSNVSADTDLSDIIPEETVTLDVYSQLANYSGEQIGWFGQIMKEKFNVKLNIINDSDGTFATRMESGDLGDIVVFGSDGDDFKQAVDAGMLFDWESEELLDDYGSYIKENMSAALEKNRSIAGKVYGFGHDVSPSADEHAAFFYYPDVRFDLYQQIGAPEINTLEDYIPAFEEMVKACPTSDSGAKTYAVSMFPDWDGNMVMFVKATAALYGYDEFGFGLYDLKTQTYEDCLKSDGMYLRCLKFYNTLYQKGLLDPDSMTQTFTDASEAYKDGAAFFNLFHWMGGDLYNSETHIAEGKAMYALTPKDATNYVDGLNVNGGNRVWTIGAKSAEPELCMAIINWLCTPEGKMIMRYGPKGVCWDYNEDGKAYLTDIGLKARSDAKGTTMDGTGYSGNYEDGEFKINNTTWADDAINPETDESYNYLMWESYNKELVPSEIFAQWREWSGSLTADEYLEDNGHIAVKIGTTFADAPKDADLTVVWSQVQECIKTYSWKAIYANSDEEYNSIVAEMTTKAKEYGYDQCVEFQQKEAETRKALEDAAK